MVTMHDVRIDPVIIRDFIRRLWGIDGHCSLLRGYAEYNFKVTTSSGESYLLKIPFEKPDFQEFDFQLSVLMHLEKNGVKAPKVIPTLSGQPYGHYEVDNQIFYGRLFTWLEGKTLDQYDRRPTSICSSIGRLTAENTSALADFRHAFDNRPFRWNTDEALWVKEYFNYFTAEQRTFIEPIVQTFEEEKPKIDQLRKSVIHNDINECNVLIDHEDYQIKAIGLIDYGDVIYSTTVNNLAISLAYLFQSEKDILSVAEHVLSSYIELDPLSSEEIAQLFTLINMRLIVSLTGAAIAKKEFPDSEYHQLNVAGSWKAIEHLHDIGASEFREACTAYAGLESNMFVRFRQALIGKQKSVSALFGMEIERAVKIIDLGSLSPLLTHKNAPYMEMDFAISMSRLQAETGDQLLLGGYGEVRSFYSTEAFAQKSLNGIAHRTQHLGLDIWLPAGTAVHALYESEVHLVASNKLEKDYGVVVILEHCIEEVVFYTLYGHLSQDTYHKLEVGQKLRQGEAFATLGTYEENGHWLPHLHFQVILDLLGQATNFDGVARPDRWCYMSNICPDPNLLFKENTAHAKTETPSELLDARNKLLGYGLSLSYEKPLHIIQGDDVWLIDGKGQKYLDTVNNVAHVGHENYAVTTAAQKQMSLLNTNTRYLSQPILEYAHALKNTFPPQLSVLHFTNSGSEANELALRMAKTHTSRENIVAIEVGYHGNTQGTIDISAYKFASEGGQGKPKSTFLLDLPDGLRGKYQGSREEVASLYIEDALEKLNEWQEQGVSIAAFIHESILSCGGQIVLPPGYLKAVYKAVRDMGGVVIADEVQVGFGRVGECFWGFELQDVVPDIVVMGKPIGNGHPMGAVICTEEIARSFDNGMEYFNTFGGNPVSAVTGLAVLREIEECKLQENAWLVGRYLQAKLKVLQQDFPCIAEIRGHGLFLGIELLDEFGKPDARLANYIVQAMRERRVLMSSDGPDHNVLKIKPSMTFSMKHADLLITNLREVLELAR